MLLHSDILSWFRANQPLLLLFNAVSSVSLSEKQQIPILQSLVHSDQGSNTRDNELETSTLIITLPIRFLICINVLPVLHTSYDNIERWDLNKNTKSIWIVIIALDLMPRHVVIIVVINKVDKHFNYY